MSRWNNRSLSPEEFAAHSILIKTAANLESHTASFTAYHVGERKILLTDSFNGIYNVSDNAICYYAIGIILEFCETNFFNAHIFSSNSVATGWVEKKTANSNLLRPENTFYEKIQKVERYIRLSPNLRPVYLWLPKWGKIRDVINGSQLSFSLQDIRDLRGDGLVQFDPISW